MEIMENSQTERSSGEKKNGDSYTTASTFVVTEIDLPKQSIRRHSSWNDLPQEKKHLFLSHSVSQLKHTHFSILFLVAFRK